MTVTEPAPPGSASPVSSARGREYPGPSMLAVPGLLRKLWFDRLSLLTDAASEFGDVVRFAMGPKTIYFFNHPDHAKHVLSDNASNYHKGMGLAEARRRILGDGLLTSEDEVWKRQRRIIAPAFRRDRLAGFTSVVTDAGEALVGRLNARVGGTVDLAEEMTQLTMSVLGKTLLAADLSPLRMLGPAFEVAQDQAMFEMVTLGALPIWLPLPRNYRFRRARGQLEEAVEVLVSSRTQAGARDGTDLLSLLSAAYASEPDARARWRVLRDELVTILLAGHETTASTLSWTWYLLSRHPEAAAALHAEAVEVLGDRTPGHEDLARLPYTTTVIQEAMRLYPPVWGLTRKSVAADEIDGYRIPAGADVMICPYTLHRHPGFWPEPDEFRPERFATSAAVTTHRYAYIPFGAGPRVCVGSHLGMMEATLIAAMVARDFRFELAAGARPQPEAMLALRVRGGLPVRVCRA
ncbi:MAG: cytochrome P450 [Actinomycetota bacterium]|nr:cytochrome P450 [Actinomycetota bacterium]